MRLNSEHYEIIVNFAETYPEIITNKFVGLNSRQRCQKLWDLLANKLNSLGYGTLTVAEYKRRLTDWKSKVKGKAASVNKSLSQTGGGQGVGTIITKLEDRLLSLIGDKAYDGDNVQEMGIKIKKSNDSLDSTKTLKKAKYIPATITSFSAQTCGVTNDEEPPGSLNSQQLPRQLPSTNAYDLDEVIPENISDIIDEEPEETITLQCDFEESTNIEPQVKTPSVSTSRRKRLGNLAESVQEMNNETLDVLKRVNENLERINTNLSGINTTLANIFLFLKSQSQ